MRTPTEKQKEKLIADANQAQQELMASADGTYPKVDLHALRHETRKDHPLYGREYLDPNPMQPPSGIKPPPSLLQQMRDQILISKMAALDELHETEEEADDFDIPDEPADPTTRWENDFEPSLKELRENRERIERMQKELQEAAAQRPPSSLHSAPQGQSAYAQPGATPPQRSGGGEDIAQPGGPPLPSPPQAPNKSSFFGRGS